MAEMLPSLRLGAGAPANDRVLRIGIQIRVGDDVLNTPNNAPGVRLDDYMSYFDCARQIEGHAKPSPDTKVLELAIMNMKWPTRCIGALGI